MLKVCSVGARKRDLRKFAKQEAFRDLGDM